MKQNKIPLVHKILFYVGIAWFLYSIIIFMAGSCGRWAEEKEDGWYIMYEECEHDGHSQICHDIVLDGPFTKEEAENIIKECEEKGEELKRKYGTIYNYAKSDYFLIELLLILIFFLGPLIGIYYISKAIEKKDE